MKTNKKRNTTKSKSVLENLKIYRQKHKKGSEYYNNRTCDPFHVYVEDYNINNIIKLTESIRKLYFPKQECYTCSGNAEPRPHIECYKKPGCHWWIHWRGEKDDKSNPVMEPLKDSFKPGELIYLSRPNFVWLLDHPEYEYIIRTTTVNGWVLHHSTIDPFNDSPGSIKIVNGLWHLNTHSELKITNKKIQDLEMSLIINGENKKDIEELMLQKELRDMLIKRLTTIDDDPDILRCLFEIQRRIKIDAI